MNICWTFLVLLPAGWKQKVRLFIGTWRLPSMAKKFDKAKKLSALCRTSQPAKARLRKLENPTAKSDLIENLWGKSVEADIIVLKWIWKVLFSQRKGKSGLGLNHELCTSFGARQSADDSWCHCVRCGWLCSAAMAVLRSFGSCLAMNQMSGLDHQQQLGQMIWVWPLK